MDEPEVFQMAFWAGVEKQPYEGFVKQILDPLDDAARLCTEEAEGKRERAASDLANLRSAVTQQTAVLDNWRALLERAGQIEEYVYAGWLWRGGLWVTLVIVGLMVAFWGTVELIESVAPGVLVGRTLLVALLATTGGYVLLTGVGLSLPRRWLCRVAQNWGAVVGVVAGLVVAAVGASGWEGANGQYVGAGLALVCAAAVSAVTWTSHKPHHAATEALRAAVEAAQGQLRHLQREFDVRTTDSERELRDSQERLRTLLDRRSLVARVMTTAYQLGLAFGDSAKGPRA